MITPERRTRTDLIVTAVLVAVVLVAAFGAWSFSSARKASSVVAAQALPNPEPLLQLPARLIPAWRAHATEPPLAIGATVVYADGDAVLGVAATTGEQVWRYARGEAVCALAENAGLILAFYPDARGCGEVTALEASTGQRRYARSSRADEQVTVITDGTHTVSQGPSRVDVLRTDLVLTMVYGEPDTAVNPGTQPRWGCTQLSAMPAGSQIVMLERCPDEPSPRITRAAAVPKEAVEPEIDDSTIVPALGTEDGVRLIAVSGDGAAVFVPAQGDRSARVVVLDARGEQLTSTDVPSGPGGAPPAVPVMTDAGIASLYTGAAAVVVDTADLRVSLIVPGAVGPGAVIGGELVVPGRTTLSAYRLGSGQLVRSTPVRRDGYRGEPIEMAVAGSTIVTRWGETIAAYSPG